MYDYNYYISIIDKLIPKQVQQAIINIFFAIVILYILTTLVKIISKWVLFRKAGKHGWAAIIPIYNLVVLYQISKVSPGLIVLLFIPIVNFVATVVLWILICMKLPIAFGKGVGYLFGLLFLPIIFYPLLAFGKNEYQK